MVEALGQGLITAKAAWKLLFPWLAATHRARVCKTVKIVGYKSRRLV